MITLQKTDLSLAVPMANALSFVFTAIMARILGEKRASLSMFAFTYNNPIHSALLISLFLLIFKKKDKNI